MEFVITILVLQVLPQLVVFANASGTVLVHFSRRVKVQGKIDQAYIKEAFATATVSLRRPTSNKIDNRKAFTCLKNQH